MCRLLIGAMALFLLLQSPVLPSDNFLWVPGSMLEFSFLSLFSVIFQTNMFTWASFSLSWLQLLAVLHANRQPWYLLLHLFLLHTCFTTHPSAAPYFIPVLVIYCCVSNYHKLCGLKNVHLLSPCFRGSRVWAQLTWVLCARSHKVTIMLLAGLCYHLKAWLGKSPLPSSFKLFAEFISLCLPA